MRNVASVVIVTLWQLSLMLPVTGTGAQASDVPAVCEQGRWLAPHTLHTREGYRIFMERPIVLPMGGRTLMVSFVARTSDSAGKFTFPLAPSGLPKRIEEFSIGVLEDSNGVSELVPMPHELTVAFSDAEGTVDENGIAHFIWASNDSTPVDSYILKRSLWYARFDGARWSTPQRILTTKGTITWISSNRSSLVARGTSLHLAVAITGEGTLYIRYADGVWTNHHVPVPAHYAGYPHVAVTKSGRVVLFVQGSVRSERTNFMSGMYATWSDDGGKSWMIPPVHVSDADGEPAYDAQLFVDETDTLSAIWYQQTDDQGNPALRMNFGSSPGRIHMARSGDGGATWLHAAPSRLLANAGSLYAILRSDRSILVALANGASEQILTTSWFNRWTPFVIHEAKPAPFNPTLGLDGAQRPVLTWGIRRSHDWVGTMATSLVPCR